jgi:hypothetical protein
MYYTPTPVSRPNMARNLFRNVQQSRRRLIHNQPSLNSPRFNRTDTNLESGTLNFHPPVNMSRRIPKPTNLKTARRIYNRLK